MPDMREEFEAWWNLPAQSELRKSCARGWAEVIWKASRAALRVELPAKRSYSMYATKHECHAFNDAIEKVKEALRQAGIEVAP
ncbi:Uncharacterised protein [Pseudomonas aeruginosa]|uniref:hypothetical protein n=1 Tax=Pseudomonas aeruginosa TaxID=287 RepID=UPI0009A779C3|nr:hypothetical protein [Pseudomonas aeruginosa]SUC58850.1 Uncharacterised protein [Pseudomonas aeruginosa]